MSDDPHPVSPPAPADVSKRRDRDDPVGLGDEPPVVARLVVEIRSDGRRTIARGALEDRLEDQRVGIEIDTGSPLSLALSLARALLQIPQLGRDKVAHATRRRFPGLLRRRKDDDSSK